MNHFFFTYDLTFSQHLVHCVITLPLAQRKIEIFDKIPFFSLSCPHTPVAVAISVFQLCGFLVPLFPPLTVREKRRTLSTKKCSLSQKQSKSF